MWELPQQPVPPLISETVAPDRDAPFACEALGRREALAPRRSVLRPTPRRLDERRKARTQGLFE